MVVLHSIWRQSVWIVRVSKLVSKGCKMIAYSTRFIKIACHSSQFEPRESNLISKLERSSRSIWTRHLLKRSVISVERAEVLETFKRPKNLKWHRNPSRSSEGHYPYSTSLSFYLIESIDSMSIQFGELSLFVQTYPKLGKSTNFRRRGALWRCWTFEVV